MTDDARGSLDAAMRQAAVRLKHERLAADQAAFLEDAARRWEEAARLRAFLAAVDGHVDDGRTPELRRWLAWARAHCDALDPLSAAGVQDLLAHAASLRPPPDLGPPDPEEAMWRDMGWLDAILDEDAEG